MSDQGNRIMKALSAIDDECGSLGADKLKGANFTSPYEAYEYVRVIGEGGLKLVTEMIENQNLRISSLSKEQRKKMSLDEIGKEDVEKTIKESESDVFNQKGIGFRASSS